MADANMQNFDKRMNKILREHSRISKGYTPRMTKDGLIVAQPKRRVRLPWRPILFLLIVGFGAKVFFHASMGPEAYDARVSSLFAGTQAEQVGAWVMKADPITKAASAQVAALLD